MGGRLGREQGDWHAVNPVPGVPPARAAPTCRLGGSEQVSVGLAGHRVPMHLEATEHGCSEGSVAASTPATLVAAVPCGVSQLWSSEAVWAHRAA